MTGRADEILPERLEGDGLVVRRWVIDDAPALAEAVDASADHLRPWMPWIPRELVTVGGRRELIAEWERAWLAGGDVLYGVFRDGRVVGGCGLHRRIAADGLEFGYWVHVRYLRQGLATSAARLLADGAFSVPGITHVEIHHDKANVASGGVPRALGFAFLGERQESPEAPGEIGIDLGWRMDRENWKHR